MHIGSNKLEYDRIKQLNGDLIELLLEGMNILLVGPGGLLTRVTLS